MISVGYDQGSFNTHQNSDHRIVIRIRDIEGEILDNIKEASNEVVIHKHYPQLISYQSRLAYPNSDLPKSSIFTR